MPGVGLVSISGGQRPAVRIQTNPRQLAALGLTLEDVRTAIASANVNQAKGSFDGPHQASTIDGNDQLKSADEYRGVIIAYRNGAPVRLSDVARGGLGGKHPPGRLGRRHPAIILNVQRQPGANVIQVATASRRCCRSCATPRPARWTSRC